MAIPRSRNTTPERFAAEQAVLARRLHRMTGELTTAATTRMDETLPWFSALSPRERTAVSLVAQAGVKTFEQWFLSAQDAPVTVDDVFGSAPREMARSVSLQQTVELLRTTMTVVEESVEKIAGDNVDRQNHLRDALLRYSREIAFAAADVYARAAENRGAWDARLQDLVLDAILNDEPTDSIASRASAAGWTSTSGVTTLVGPVSSDRDITEIQIEQIRRTAKSLNLDVIVGVQSDRMIAVLGGIGDDTTPLEVAKHFAGHFGSGSIVGGPLVADLSQAADSINPAISGYRALPLTSDPGRLVSADSLLAARVLNGDQAARAALSTHMRNTLNADLRSTLSTFLEHTPSIEACARAQFVHVNTVRYRLKRIHEVTGLDPANAADALILRLGLMLERENA